MNEEIKGLMAGVLNVSLCALEDDLSIGDIPEWDSLHHLMMITKLQHEFGIVFDPQELINLETVADIVNAVISKISSKK